jgi:hypothetical protein
MIGSLGTLPARKEMVARYLLSIRRITGLSRYSLMIKLMKALTAKSM